jgi:plasmid stability protein
MPTLYVENVPRDLYAALRKRAKKNRSSISAEVIALLKQWVPTEKEIARRHEWFLESRRIQAEASGLPGPSAEEMLREDREREEPTH